ncbi:dihydrolipoamide acetyltransferase family protein [Paenibacillus sp. PvR098]|uniref:dihydrolipoamide acetyltransferase family protein n=1 Tax=unclassified Paenibacillus TaxID=185978 RepID=UPI001B4522C8|nr:2-oxoisovalerate dehydrogenase E2 component (dihydrolipoyl transacylase) [Paenibacillus sp. PvP091]MBP1169455.1 2-oxoisovalerate dehydrogenase E2 component (dihydrolipoyl transacylase) [Paenibacillus sp. PvR098]MBP2440483.1 2-oxoisovalerate dehydrogenase E2 component (dihydrolipoyl transacylase) [Paenibacillus sp. PvP052]
MKENIKGTEVTVPHLAESLVSATVGKWLKQPGDYIEQYDVLCELITDKVTVEMPSPIEGRLVRLLVDDGATAAVGEAICIIEEPQQAAAGAAGHGGQQPEQLLSTSSRPSAEAGNTGMGSRFSPAVLKLAAENGISLSDIQGTGLGGRITRKDVEAFVASGTAARSGWSKQAANANMAAATAGVFIPEPPKVSVRSTGIHLSETPPLAKIEVEGHPEGRGEYLIDVTPIRNTIASRMRQSVTEIPHAWTMIEVDVTNLVLLRSKLKDEFMKQEGINLTYLAFLLKAVVSAIKDYPIMNSVWAVDKIIVKRDINISLAVGTEDFVVTPVIKKADQKNIAGLAREIDDLTRRGRAGKLSLSDLEGGTFTVNNTGSFGSILSYPIINYPQAAILTFESIVKKPVVIQDMIAVRSMVNLCLSLDHRILDGVICGRFLQRVKENLEGFNQDTKLY